MKYQMRHRRHRLCALGCGGPIFQKKSKFLDDPPAMLCMPLCLIQETVGCRERAVEEPVKPELQSCCEQNSL